MTSEARFFNLLKEDMKNRSISLVLSSIVEFILFPVAILVYFSSNGYSAEDSAIIHGVIENILIPSSIFVAIIGAIICAYASFDYVFSRSKVDFYNSVPFTRKKIFWARYLNGILVYLVPFLVFLALSIPIYAVNVRITDAMIRAFVRLVITGFISFMIVYNLFILGAMLSGNHANAGFFAAIFSSVSGLSVLVIIGYMSTFFSTFAIPDKLEFFAKRITIGYYVVRSNYLRQNLIPSLIIIAVLIVLNYFLFVKRRFENSNAGGIYRTLDNVVRFYLEILIALSGGLFFCVTADRSFGWLIFGILLGAVISHILINALFNMSIKGALNQPVSLVAAILISIIVSGFIRFDVFGYDRYIADEKDLDSIEIDFNYFSELMPSRRAIFSDEIKKDEIIKLQNSDFYDNYNLVKKISSHEMGNIKISDDLSAAYEFVKLAKQDSLDKTENTYLDHDFTMHLTVSYNLKNKQKVSRKYTVNISANDQKDRALTKLFYSKSFKQGILDNLLVRDIDMLDGVMHLRHSMYDQKFSYPLIKEEYYDKIYEAMKTDIVNMNINEWFMADELKPYQVNELRFVYKLDNGYDILDIPVTAGLTETVKVLSEIDGKEGKGIFGHDDIDLITIYSDKKLDGIDIEDKELIGQITAAVDADLKSDNILKWSNEIQLAMFKNHENLATYTVALDGKTYEVLKSKGLIE